MAEEVKLYPHSFMIAATFSHLGVGFLPFSETAIARRRSRSASAFHVAVGLVAMIST